MAVNKKVRRCWAVLFGGGGVSILIVARRVDTLTCVRRAGLRARSPTLRVNGGRSAAGKRRRVRIRRTLGDHMDRTNRIRWRHRRDTLPARRRRRRWHRRDRACGDTYYPMQVDPDSALRGVRSRLVGAMAAASITLISFVYALLSSLTTFGATFALTVGVCSFGAAVALLLSARHEEEVHELASSFDRDERALEAPDEAPALLESDPLDEFSFQNYERDDRVEVTVDRDLPAAHTDGAI